MTWMLLNIPLMVVFIALWTGIPLWMVLKRKDTEPTVAAAAVRNLPARQEEADYRRVA